MPTQISDRIRLDTIAVPQFWGHAYNSGQTRARQRPGININRLHATSAAAQKWLERGSCGAGGVVDPFEWGGGGVAMLDEGEHPLDEFGA